MPRGWRNNPEYQMSEGHHDPHMRPSVDHLLFQLKNHRALKGHPDAVALVIKRMAYHFFRFEAERPANMFHTATDLMYQFLGQMGGGYPDANDEKMREFRQQLPLELGNAIHNAIEGYLKIEQRGAGTGGNEEAILWAPGSSPSRLSPGEAPQGENQNSNSEMGIKKVLEEGEKERGEASGIDFMNSALRNGVEEVIRAHQRDVRGRCQCGRDFSFDRDWAKHVRIRIWRYLQNEFKGDD